MSCRIWRCRCPQKSSAGAVPDLLALQGLAIVAVRLAMQPRTESHRGLRTMAGRLYPGTGPDLPEGVAHELYEPIACVGMQFMGHLSHVDLQQVRSLTPA